jgi:hypothetical protein
MKPSDQIAQYIRKLAKRGTNAKLLEALNKIYIAGMEEGMKALSNQLKERIHGLQGIDLRNNDGGEQQEPDSEESAERLGADANDADSHIGSPATV